MQREHKWDNLKGILIALVVIGHFIEPFLDASQAYKSIWLFIYSFHMPLFFVIAGYFHKNENVGRKTCYYVALCLLTGIAVFIGARLLGSKPALHYLEISSLPWFMLSMAICIVLTYLIRDIDPYFMLGIAIIIGLFSGYDDQIGDMVALSRTIVFFPFYLLGRCLRMNESSLITISRKTWIRIVSGIVIAGWLVLCYYKISQVYLLRPFFTGRNPFSASKINAPGSLIRLACYIITMLLSMAFIFIAPNKQVPLLSNMGKRTLQIFVLHNIVRNAVTKLMSVDEFLNDPDAKTMHLIIYLAAALLTALILSLEYFSAPFDYLKQKFLKETAEGRSMTFAERRAQNGAFSLKKDELIVAFSVALFFAFTLLFYGPLGLYLENAEELWFSLKTTLIIVVPVSVAGLASILLLAWMLPRRAADWLLRVLFGITLAMYIQGTLINISYGGVLDGTSINWGDYTLYGLTTLLLWAICITAPLLLKRFEKVPLRKIIIIVSLFLTVIQIPALIVERISYTPGEQKSLLVSKDGEFEFAEYDNVIIIAMDTMDEAYFQQYMDENPEFENELTGFVHYDNAVASGSRTIIGLPSMLTGIPYKRESTFTEYINRIWENDNPLSALHEEGYDVRVYTDKSFFSLETLDYVDNFVNTAEKVGSYRILAEKLYKLTAYKFSQHYFKQIFWLDTSEFSEAEDDENRYKTNDGYFYKDYLESGLIISDRYDRSFHYYLLNGAHTPYRLNEKAEYVSKTTSRDQQVAGVFKIVREMLAEMKKKGIYDSAYIILTTDHGNEHVEEHSSFLYKSPYNDHPFSTSHAPVSMFDLPVWLYAIAGREMPNNEYGIDFRSLSEDTERERHFFRNTSGNSKIVIEEYVTRSDVQNREAFQLASTFEDQRGPDTPYTFGDTLTFDMNATGNIYGVEGFGQNTGFRTLLVGPEARILMTLETVPEDGFLDISFGIHSIIDNEKEVVIRVNGKAVFDDVVNKQYASSGISFRVPVNEIDIKERKLEIGFEFPDIPQDEMSIPTQQRTRSFSLTSLVITHESD